MKLTKDNSVKVKHKRNGQIMSVAKTQLNALHIRNNYDIYEEPQPKKKAKKKAKKKKANA